MSFDFIMGRGIPRRPTLEKMFAVAAGLDEWNAEEKAWIAENPKWLDYSARLKREIAEADAARSKNLTPQRSFADHAFHV
jgi:hypothetical protein